MRIDVPRRPGPIGVLTDTDRFWLAQNLELAPDGSPDDPQAQAVFAVEDNILDFDCPRWDLAETRCALDRLASDHGIELVLETRRWMCGAEARFDSNARVGTIVLPAEGMVGEYSPSSPGCYAAWVPLHEMAHVLTVVADPSVPSHGPEFVGMYLGLLEGQGVDCRRGREALRYLGVRHAAPHLGATSVSRR